MKRFFFTFLKAAGWVIGASVVVILWKLLCGLFGIEPDGQISALICFSLVVVSLYLEDK